MVMPRGASKVGESCTNSVMAQTTRLASSIEADRRSLQIVHVNHSSFSSAYFSYSGLWSFWHPLLNNTVALFFSGVAYFDLNFGWHTGNNIAFTAENYSFPFDRVNLMG